MKRRFSSEHIISVMETTGMIPVFFHDDAGVAQAIVDACYAGGVRVFEFTNRGAGAARVFETLVGHVRKYDDAILGMGTVMNAADTHAFIDAGADFIVSPILKPEMGSACIERTVPWIPGCATLTEIVTAKEHGAEVIKVFPGSVLGPAFVSAIRPVVPGLKLMPTGGIEPERDVLEAWFKAGVVCVGLGSQLLEKNIVNGKKWTELEQKVKRTLDLIRQLRA